MSIRSTEVWQRFVVRGVRNPKTVMIYPGIVWLLFMIADEFVDYYTPILNLSQMKQVTGKIARVYESGKNRFARLDIIEGSGDLKTLEFYHGSVHPKISGQLRSWRGEEVNVWYQERPDISFIILLYDDVIMQIQHNDQLLYDYEIHERRYLEKIQREGVSYMFFLVSVPITCIMILFIWRENGIKEDKSLKMAGGQVYDSSTIININIEPGSYRRRKPS